jgi:hypothetical protein
MRSGRFKVASHLSDWFEEFRLYHRKDCVIVKVNDDLMSATRIAVMGRRYAKPNTGFSKRIERRAGTEDRMSITEFDLFQGY